MVALGLGLGDDMGTITEGPHGRSPSKLSAPGQACSSPPPSTYRACNDLRGFFSSRTWEGRWVRSPTSIALDPPECYIPSQSIEPVPPGAGLKGRGGWSGGIPMGDILRGCGYSRMRKDAFLSILDSTGPSAATDLVGRH